MKITSFNPLTVTKNEEAAIALFADFDFAFDLCQHIKD